MNSSILYSKRCMFSGFSSDTTICKAVQVPLVIIMSSESISFGKRKCLLNTHPRYLNYDDKTKEIKYPRITTYYIFWWTFKASQVLEIHNENFIKLNTKSS